MYEYMYEYVYEYMYEYMYEYVYNCVWLCCCFFLNVHETFCFLPYIIICGMYKHL